MPYDHVIRRASVIAILAAVLLASACTGTTPSPVVGTAVAQALQLQGLGDLAVDQYNAGLQAALINPDPKAQLRMANSLWMHLSENPILPSFVSTNETYYAAKIGDLSGAPDDVRVKVKSGVRT